MADGVKNREWKNTCTFVPGSGDTVEQVSEGEKMWKCFKRGNTSNPAASSPHNSPSVSLSRQNPLTEGIRNVLRSPQDFLTFSGRWRRPDKPSQYMLHDFGLVYSTFESDTRYKKEEGDSFPLCTVSKKGHPEDHVLISGLNENWGLMSSYVPNRTMFSSVSNCSKDGNFWNRGSCNEQGLRAYLDSETLKAIVTSQHHCFVHPKVWSFPQSNMHVCERLTGPTLCCHAEFLYFTGKGNRIALSQMD